MLLLDIVGCVFCDRHKHDNSLPISLQSIYHAGSNPPILKLEFFIDAQLGWAKVIFSISLKVQ